MQASSDSAQREKYAELILQQFDHIGAMQREVLEFARGEKSVLVRKVYVQKFFDDVRQQLETDLAGEASSWSSTCRNGARRASTRVRCCASCTTWRATRRTRWGRRAGSW
jgi:hypothetical protein